MPSSRLQLFAATLCLTSVASASLAVAQPVDPYGGSEGADDPPAPGAAAGNDAAIDEAVAAALVARAQQLIEIEAWADAQQLLGEAVVRSPDGAAAKKAAELLYFVNARLTVPVKPDHSGPGVGDPIDPAETLDPTDQQHDPENPITDDVPRPGAGKGSLAFHMATFGAAFGVLLFDPHLEPASETDDSGPSGAFIGGMFLGGVAGALGGYYVGKKYDLTVDEARTVGSLTTWGTVTGALMGDVFGADVDGTDLEVEDGAYTTGTAVVGGAVGLIAGEVMRRKGTYTRHDVAVIDSMGAIGLVGGLTMGQLMQPTESEGYSLNAALGAGGGVVLGMYLAGKHDISTRRMVRIDLWAGAGALVPWLLYGLSSDDTTNDDEQTFGFLSTAGLVTGALIGRKVSRKLDADRNVAGADAPAALLRRGSDGAWSVGTPGLRPANSRTLGQVLGRGAAVDLVGVRF